MPVRSSLCTYSPSAIGASASNSSSKYSSILPTSSPLSYGNYKPLSSSSSSSSSTSSSRASFRSTASRHLGPSTGSSRSSFTSRYSLTAGSPSSYSPSSSSNSSSLSSLSGLYKPLESPAASSLRHGSGGTGRYSSSSSTNSLSSTASTHDHLYAYSAYKSPSSSSAYSSGSSLSSNYISRNRRPSYAPKRCVQCFKCYIQTNPEASPSNTDTCWMPCACSTSPSPSSSPSPPLSPSTPSGDDLLVSPPHDVVSCPDSPLDDASPLLDSPNQWQSYSTSSSLVTAGASDTSEPPLPAGVPAGLINLGNTCYMNASLQAVYSIDPLRELLVSNSFRGSSDKELTSQLSDLFKLMKNNANGAGPVSPADFKYTFSRYQTKFSGFAQQDAQEFLRYLINGVHEEFNRARSSNRRPTGASSPKTSQEAWQQYRRIVDDSPLVDLLVGQLCSTITCSECNHQSHCWDPFWDLSLPLSMRRAADSKAGRFGSPYVSSSYGSTFSLREVIDEFTSRETLDGDERPTCAQCKRPTRSTKQISWARLPQVLFLHLKKFTNDGFKLSSPDIEIDKQLTFNTTNTYHLKASISHHGHSSSSGHYTSNCQYAGRWFHFDDARVRDVTNTFDCAKLQDAYVLFYTLKQPTSPARRLSQSKL